MLRNLNFIGILHWSENFLHNLICVCLVHNLYRCMLLLRLYDDCMSDCSFCLSLYISVSLSVFLLCWRTNVFTDGLAIDLTIFRLVARTKTSVTQAWDCMGSVASQWCRFCSRAAALFFWCRLRMVHRTYVFLGRSASCRLALHYTSILPCQTKTLLQYWLMQTAVIWGGTVTTM